MSRGISLKKDNSRKNIKKKDYSKSSEVSDLIRTRMTLHDIDTWRVLSCVFIGADVDFDIHFALNDDPEAQNRYKFRIVMAEMSHEIGPWHA